MLGQQLWRKRGSTSFWFPSCSFPLPRFYAEPSQLCSACTIESEQRNASDYIDLGMGGRGGGGRFGPGKEMISRDGAGGRRRREVPGKLWKEAGAPLRYISKLKLSTDELRSYSWAEFEINLVFNQTKEAEPNWPRLVTFSLQSRI